MGSVKGQQGGQACGGRREGRLRLRALAGHQKEATAPQERHHITHPWPCPARTYWLATVVAQPRQRQRRIAPHPAKERKEGGERRVVSNRFSVLRRYTWDTGHPNHAQPRPPGAAPVKHAAVRQGGAQRHKAGRLAEPHAPTQLAQALQARAAREGSRDEGGQTVGMRQPSRRLQGGDAPAPPLPAPPRRATPSAAAPACAPAAGGRGRRRGSWVGAQGAARCCQASFNQAESAATAASEQAPPLPPPPHPYR